jgi:hypothetical protein
VQVKEAKQRVAQYYAEQEEREKARNTMSKEVADIIEKHSKYYDIE